MALPLWGVCGLLPLRGDGARAASWSGSESALMNHRADEASYWLEQIAAALGIPASTFLQPQRELLSADAAMRQEEELLRLFRKIRDPDFRERLLGFVRAAAGGAGRSEG